MSFTSINYPGNLSRHTSQDLRRKGRNETNGLLSVLFRGDECPAEAAGKNDFSTTVNYKLSPLFTDWWWLWWCAEDVFLCVCELVIVGSRLCTAVEVHGHDSTMTTGMADKAGNGIFFGVSCLLGNGFWAPQGETAQE